MKNMTCECGRTIEYNNYYHCYECYECNNCYNAIGQELAPRKNWQSEYDEEDYYY